MAFENMHWLSIFYCVLPVVAIVWWFRYPKNALDLLPGPKPLPILGNLLQVKDTVNLHKTFTRWHKEFGPVFKIRLLNYNTVVISGYDALHEALVLKGSDTGGRSYFFRSSYIGLRTGILLSVDTDATWRGLRKVGQRHLKQFGDGLSRLETMIGEIAKDMFERFQNVTSTPFDPAVVIRDTAAKTISFLLSGERLGSGHAILERMETYEKLFLKAARPIAHPRFMMYDWMPWLRHLGLKSWQEIHHTTEVRNAIWEEVKDMANRYPENRSFARLLLSHCHDVSAYRPEDTACPGFTFKETDAKMATTSMMLAGITTTTVTFYSAINILAHKRKVQETIRGEIERAVSPGTAVAVKDKHAMPYTRAFIYEVLRYTSVVPLSMSHRAVQDVQIGGYTIPKDTRIQLNLWALHHDPEFWKDPEEFRPERFLDENGEVVAADHPNRKHLMPFGAGPRVCLGESLALTRLFVWTASMIQKFRIAPAEGNNVEIMAANSYWFNGTLSSHPYRVIFHQIE